MSPERCGVGVTRERRRDRMQLASHNWPERQTFGSQKKILRRGIFACFKACFFSSAPRQAFRVGTGVSFCGRLGPGAVSRDATSQVFRVTTSPRLPRLPHEWGPTPVRWNVHVSGNCDPTEHQLVHGETARVKAEDRRYPSIGPLPASPVLATSSRLLRGNPVAGASFGGTPRGGCASPHGRFLSEMEFFPAGFHGSRVLLAF